MHAHDKVPIVISYMYIYNYNMQCDLLLEAVSQVQQIIIEHNQLTASVSGSSTSAPFAPSVGDFPGTDKGHYNYI